MALLKTKVRDIPADAVVLTEEQAVKYQLKLIHSWNNPWDVAAFRYGPYVLTTSTLASSIYFNNYFRMKFKLAHYGRAGSYLMVCLVPTVFTFVLHNAAVLKDVVLVNTGTCPICLETRAASFQALLACVVPAVFSPLANASVASMYYTYNIPNLSEEPRKLWELIRQKFKPLKGTFVAILTFQMLLASVVTYLEADSVFRVHRKMSTLEKEDVGNV